MPLYLNPKVWNPQKVSPMNRRDALKAAAGVVAYVAPGSTVSAIEAKKPLAILVRCPVTISKQARHNLEESCRFALRGTDLASVPILIAAGGIDISVIEDPRVQK